MTKVDQFESAFRAAAKEVYVPTEVKVQSVLALHDLETGGDEFVQRARSFLGVLGDDPSWTVATPSDFVDLAALLGRVEEEQPDLVCTYRNLGSEAWKWPYSLGEHLDVLTQLTHSPVLVMPHPLDGRAYEHALLGTDCVMAVTNHLTGDSRLVDWGRHFTTPGGDLWLAHVEDEQVFERYAGVISRIPSIDTDEARETILERLQKEPLEYAESVRAALADQDLRVEQHVSLGHTLAQYRALVREHEVDLLIMETKDEDQLAMHGLAHPLAIEIREIPLLMI